MTTPPKTIAIIGASGFVGQNLLRHLLETTDDTVRALCRHPDTIVFDAKYQSRVQLVHANVLNHATMEQDLAGVDAAVYLIHMMAAKGEYYSLETRAAHAFGSAALAAGVERVVYMGGLGNDADKLSKHLRSRHHTGEILRQYIPELIEFRASMIVGDGSAAYDIMKRFVKRLPIQTMPRWAVTQTQPITLHDALQYLAAGLEVAINQSEIVEIGGPEQLSYKDLIQRYASFVGKKPLLIVVPIVPLWLGALWLNIFTPEPHARIGKQMAESLANPMIVTNDRAMQLFPHIKPHAIEAAFTR